MFKSSAIRFKVKPVVLMITWFIFVFACKFKPKLFKQ